MRDNIPPKFQTEPLTEEQKEHMLASYNECLTLKERDLRCPHCKASISGVFSDATGHLRVKCQKCKANMVLNLAYFRKSKGYGEHKRFSSKN